MHADTATLEETDWPQIVALYDQLLAIAPTPVVALNRAIAIGEVRGAGRSTPREPIFSAGSAVIARRRPPMSARPS